MSLDTSILLREWALVVPVTLLLLAPGSGFAYAFGSRHRLSAAWMISLAFSWGVAWCATLAIAAFYLGLHFDVVAVLYVLAIPVSGWFGWRALRADIGLRKTRAEHGTPLPPRRIGLGGLLLGLCAMAAAMIEQPWWFGTPDSYYHIAASRSLLVTGRPIVTDPFFGTTSNLPDSTAGMWNTVQAVVARVLGVDVATVYPALTAFAALIVILSFWVLAYEAGRSRPAATIATAGYFLFAWYADFRAFGYPNKISIALALAAIALMLRLSTRPQRPFVIAAGLTGFSALAVHLASGELFLLCGAAMAFALAVVGLARRDRETRKRTWHGAGAIVLAMILAVLIELPTLYPRVAALRGSTVLGEDSFIWAGEQIVNGAGGLRWVVPGGFDFGGAWLFWLTLAIAGLAAFAVVKGDSPRTAAVIAVLVLAPLISSFPPVSTVWLNFSSYMVARMLELLRFAPYVAAAWALGRVPSAIRPAARLLGAALLIAALITQWPYFISTYVQGAGEERRGNKFSVVLSQSNDVRKEFGFDAIYRMRAIFKDQYPVVAADPTTGYHLMGLVDSVMLASLPSHTPVFMDREEVNTRFTEMIWFFNEHADNVFRRAIFEKYDVEYVFVWKVFDGRVVTREIASMPELERAYENANVVLFRVKDRADWPDEPGFEVVPGTDEITRTVEP